MSYECPECESDLRGGHAASCSRYKADDPIAGLIEKWKHNRPANIVSVD
jgi:hypothetical protein